MLGSPTKDLWSTVSWRWNRRLVEKKPPRSPETIFLSCALFLENADILMILCGFKSFKSQDVIKSMKIHRELYHVIPMPLFLLLTAGNWEVGPQIFREPTGVVPPNVFLVKIEGPVTGIPFMYDYICIYIYIYNPLPLVKRIVSNISNPSMNIHGNLGHLWHGLPMKTASFFDTPVDGDEATMWGPQML